MDRTKMPVRTAQVNKLYTWLLKGMQLAFRAGRHPIKKIAGCGLRVVQDSMAERHRKRSGLITTHGPHKNAGADGAPGCWASRCDRGGAI